MLHKKCKYSKNIEYISTPCAPPLVCLTKKQGRIHGNPVADGWAGALMRKPLGIQKCDGRTDGPTDQPTDRPTDRPTNRVVYREAPLLKRTDRTLDRQKR